MRNSRSVGRWLISTLRAPVVLYDWNLGWLLGRRFVRLTHRGRRSGRVYRTMWEVIGEDRDRHVLFVMVVLGRSAQWYRSVVAGGAVEIAIGRERFRPAYRELESVEATAGLGNYEQRNRAATPGVRVVLSRLVSWHYDGSVPRAAATGERAADPRATTGTVSALSAELALGRRAVRDKRGRWSMRDIHMLRTTRLG